MANKLKAQVTIEFTLAIFCLFVFFVGTARLFAWLCSDIVGRHESYEATRASAANAVSSNAAIDFYVQNEMSLFTDGDIKGWQ